MDSQVVYSGICPVHALWLQAIVLRPSPHPHVSRPHPVHAKLTPENGCLRCLVVDHWRTRIGRLSSKVCLCLCLCLFIGNLGVRLTISSWLQLRSRRYSWHVWMGDCLQTGQPSMPFYQHQARSTQRSIPLRLRRGAFTCVGWQVVWSIGYSRWRSVALCWVTVKSYKLHAPLTSPLTVLLLLELYNKW